MPADKHYQTFLQKILMLVRANTKHDFSHYKQTTIRRRLGRRLAVHKIEDIADYFHYLQQNPAEIQNLFKDLIICVTSFFRDPEAFKILETKVIPDILSAKVAGSVHPGLGARLRHRRGAPVHRHAAGRGHGTHRQAPQCANLCHGYRQAEAIDKARMGEYPESIAADMTPERLKKYFSKRRRFLPDQAGNPGDGGVCGAESHQRPALLPPGPDQLPQCSHLPGHGCYRDKSWPCSISP